MARDIRFTLKDCYGKKRAMPENEAGAILATIAKTETLTRATLINAFKLGHSITLVHRVGEVCPLNPKLILDLEIE